MARLVPPKPLAPQAKIINDDGTPSREFHQWLSQLHDWNASPGTPSDFQPTEASIPAVGPIGRTIAQVSIKGARPPIVYVLGDNPATLKVAFSGALLNTTATPVGAVGPHPIGIRATDAQGVSYTGTLMVTLT